jgi:hypothetical protein
MMKKTVEILSILTMILAMGGCESSSPSDVPVARNDTFNVREDTILKDGDVTLNDTWSQAGGNTWYVQRDVKHGKLILNTKGKFRYTPVADYDGQDDFVYAMKDAKGHLSTAKVTLVVLPVNDPPVAKAEANVTFVVEGGSIRFDSQGSGDKEGNITFEWKEGLNVMSREPSFVAADLPVGMHTITLLVTDQGGMQASDTVTVEIGKDYANLGSKKVVRYPSIGLENGTVTYRPLAGEITADTPVVLFLEGGGSDIHIDDYNGTMQFLASQGYFVIGAESGGSYDSDEAADLVYSELSLDCDRFSALRGDHLAVMGHSQGGGQAFYVMKFMQEQGYGSSSSAVISLDGWFAFDMNQSDLEGLQAQTSFVQFNGVEGTGTDPRIHLSIWNLLDQSNKHYLIPPYTKHMDAAGDLETMLGRRDLMWMIHALLDDAFTGNNKGYRSIPQDQKTTYEAVYDALKPIGTYPDSNCDGHEYNAAAYLQHNDIDYCTPEAYR